MDDVISLEEAQVSESAYVWTNSRNLQMEWDPDAYYFDALSNRHYGKFINDTWSDEGNNCKIKWNPILRRAEVWTTMAVPLYKELGLPYNDPYWYRAHNGLRTLAQAIQVRDYYNKTNLPPYDCSTNPAMSTGSPGGRAERDGQTGQDNSTISFTTMAPNLSIITLDQDMEEARQDSRRSSLVHHANPTASVSRDEHQWQQDACTLSEMDYVQKYYEKAILTWLPIERYQGLCTGQLLHIALLEAVARAQLRPTWKGMEFLDITTLIYPLDGITCSVTSNRARRNIQTTEAMFSLHPTPMHYNAILAIKQDMKVTLIWCDRLSKNGQPALDRFSQFYHFLKGA